MITCEAATKLREKGVMKCTRAEQGALLNHVENCTTCYNSVKKNAMIGMAMCTPEDHKRVKEHILDLAKNMITDPEALTPEIV